MTKNYMSPDTPAPEGVTGEGEHLGAVEGEKTTDPQQGNANGDGLNDQGMPNDPVATCEDVLGANEDKSQG